MSKQRTIEAVWSHYGRDATGDGRSEIEILERFQEALSRGSIDDARNILPELRGISRSFGYAEADSFLSDGWDRSTDEGRAQVDHYDSALSEGDYAGCIDATDDVLRSLFPDGEARQASRDAMSGMLDGYEEGRKLREDAALTPPTPAPAPAP